MLWLYPSVMSWLQPARLAVLNLSVGVLTNLPHFTETFGWKKPLRPSSSAVNLGSVPVVGPIQLLVRFWLSAAPVVNKASANPIPHVGPGAGGISLVLKQAFLVRGGD